jgi:hypothetical protein
MHYIRVLSRKEFFRSFETLDPGHDRAHGRLCRIRWIRHGHQLRTRATQNRARMVLRMAARTKQCDAEGWIRHEYRLVIPQAYVAL